MTVLSARISTRHSEHIALCTFLPAVSQFLHRGSRSHLQGRRKSLKKVYKRRIKK